MYASVDLQSALPSVVCINEGSTQSVLNMDEEDTSAWCDGLHLIVGKIVTFCIQVATLYQIILQQRPSRTAT